jgi:hypothetical protein
MNNFYKYIMRTYYTLEPGGGKGYEVNIMKTKIIVHKIEDRNKEYIINNYKKVFVGKNSKKYGPNPNPNTGLSILVEVKEKEYIFISHLIHKFKTLEKIDKFYSQVGNSWVLYPFALTKNYAYLLIENKYLQRNFGDIDPYQVYYDFQKIWDRKSYDFKMKKINF